jgi:hypothetical protein
VASILSATLVLGACSNPVKPSPVPPSESIAISGTTRFSAIGQTSQLTALATASDGATTDVTKQASWLSSNNIVATVSPTGFVTADGFGQAEISVAYRGTSSHVLVFVSPPTPLR